MVPRGYRSGKGNDKDNGNIQSLWLRLRYGLRQNGRGFVAGVSARALEGAEKVYWKGKDSLSG